MVIKKPERQEVVSRQWDTGVSELGSGLDDDEVLCILVDKVEGKVPRIQEQEARVLDGHCLVQCLGRKERVSQTKLLKKMGK